MFNYESVELRPGGEDEDVSTDNVEEYVELVTDFCLNIGIRKQMEALRSKFSCCSGFVEDVECSTWPLTSGQSHAICLTTGVRILRYKIVGLVQHGCLGVTTGGFNKVFPLEKLFPFSPDELQLMLCGEQVPRWSRDDVVNYTEPKLGFTRERCARFYLSLRILSKLMLAC